MDAGNLFGRWGALKSERVSLRAEVSRLEADIARIQSSPDASESSLAPLRESLAAASSRLSEVAAALNFDELCAYLHERASAGCMHTFESSISPEDAVVGPAVDAGPAVDPRLTFSVALFSPEELIPVTREPPVPNTPTVFSLENLAQLYIAAGIHPDWQAAASHPLGGEPLPDDGIPTDFSLVGAYNVTLASRIYTFPVFMDNAGGVGAR